MDRLDKIRCSKDLLYDENDDFLVLLYRKNVIIDEDFDEDLYIRSLYEENVVRNPSMELTLVVTRNCNFRCTYCGQEHEDKVMPYEVYSDVLSFISYAAEEKRIRKINVSFFGGEPLLEYNNILVFLEGLKQLSKERNLQYSAGMSTNGYLLTPKRFENLARLGCLNYQISVDGMHYTHDKTRVLSGELPTWNKIMDNLKYMVSTSHPMSVLLRTNFNMEVLESLKELYGFVQEELNDSRVSIYSESIKNHGNEHTPHVLGILESAASNIEIASVLKERGLRCAMIHSRTSPGSWVCRAAQPNHFIVDYNAEVKKCTHKMDFPENTIGHLTKQNLGNLDRYLHAKWVYTDYSTRSDCKECKLLPLCFGKRCPLNSAFFDSQCDREMLEAEIEGIIAAYV